jgi:hypothetical protein
MKEAMNLHRRKKGERFLKRYAECNNRQSFYFGFDQNHDLKWGMKPNRNPFYRWSVRDLRRRFVSRGTRLGERVENFLLQSWVAIKWAVTELRGLWHCLYIVHTDNKRGKYFDLHVSDKHNFKMCSLRIWIYLFFPDFYAIMEKRNGIQWGLFLQPLLPFFLFIPFISLTLFLLSPLNNEWS